MSSRIEAQRKRWHKEIEAWRESGKTLSAWARERGHSRAVLEYWKQRFPAVKSAPLKLIALDQAPCAMQSSAPIELRSPIELVVGTTRVILAPGFDLASLVQVLQVLQARC